MTNKSTTERQVQGKSNDNNKGNGRSFRDDKQEEHRKCRRGFLTASLAECVGYFAHDTFVGRAKENKQPQKRNTGILRFAQNDANNCMNNCNCNRNRNYN